MSVLAEAEKIVNGSRDQDYGDSNENLRRTARIASAMLNKEVSPKEVAVIMIAVKFGREIHKHKRDNLVDACGYIELLNRLEDCPLSSIDSYSLDGIVNPLGELIKRK